MTTNWADKQNEKVRASIRGKISSGHPFLTRNMGGVEFIALDHGPGKCSSTFIERDESVSRPLHLS